MGDKTKEYFYERWGFILLIFVLGIGIIVNVSNRFEKVEIDKVDVADSPVYKKMEKEELREKMAQKNKTPDVIAAGLVIENLGTANVLEENAVVSSRFENGVVETIAFVEKFTSAKSLKESFMYNSVNFMKTMKLQSDVTQATLIVQAPLTDRYGNVENGDVMIVLMSRETLDRINFNHFNVENLSAVADSYWEHPALTAE